MRADGHHVSTSTVERALRRRGLLLPRGFRADRKSWAALRRKVFHDPPTDRNRVWQTDFSEFETTGGGIWRICAVIDCATKYCLAITITPTGRGSDALACLHAAVAEAQRVLGPEDLRDDHGKLELVDETTGEIIDVVPAPIAVVSDNGRAFAARPTRARSPDKTRCCATSAPASAPRRPTASNDSSAPQVRAPCIGHPSTTAAHWPWRPPASAISTTASDPTSRSGIGHLARPISARNDVPLSARSPE